MPCFSRHSGRPCKPENGTVDIVPLAPIRMRSPRVAIVYTGRWFGPEGTRAAILNHVKHLIAPNNASVFVTTDVTNWCSAPPDAVERYANDQRLQGRRKQSLIFDDLESSFCAQVAAAFDGVWADHMCALLPEEDAGIALRYQAAAAQRFGSLFGGYMRSWYLQAAHWMRANAFRRMMAVGPHDLIVRARFELRFGHPVRLSTLPTRPPVIYALTYAVDTTGEPHEWLSALTSVKRQCWRRRARPRGEQGIHGRNVSTPCPDANGATKVLWRDWLQVGNEEAMDALARMAAAPHRMHLSEYTRCFGACPEEQFMLHLDHVGLASKELDWQVALAPPTCADARWLHPLLNRSTSGGNAGAFPCSRYVRHAAMCDANKS